MQKLIDNLSSTIITSLKGNYSLLFKAAIACMVVLLASLSQVSPNLMQENFDAKKLQFEVEEEHKIELTEEACEKLEKGISKCRLAVYKLSKLEPANTLFRYVNLSSYSLCLIFMGLSILGYCLNATQNKST